LWRYGRPHWRPLAQGLTATLGYAFFRLAIPWPLRGIIEVAFPGAKHGHALVRHLPAWGEPLLWLCGAYLACAVLGGVCETVQRIGMGQFVSRSIGALRAAALRAATRRFRGVGSASGELIARLVADAARLRGYLMGILVHVSKDALLFAAVVALFLAWLSPTMGAFFLVGGALTAGVGYFAARPLEIVARRARHHDAAFAATIQKALEHGHVSDGSSDGEESAERHSARILGAASVVAHALLALTVCGAVWTGIAEVRAGLLAPGELFLFIAYSLTMHRRLVDAGRQLARIGKLRASVEQLAMLLDGADSAREHVARPLRSGVELRGLRVEALRGSRPRLADIDLELPAGSRMAVVGRAGDGKSTLLRCLAGLEPAAGTLRWDGEELASFDPTLCASVGYLPQEPVFSRAPVWKLLGLSGPDALDDKQTEVLRRIGAGTVIGRLSKGLRQKVGSATLSRSEARALCLGALLIGDAPLLVLDSPFEGLGKRAASERLEALLEAAAGRTLVVALSRARQASAFERVVVLKRGRILFGGSPAERLTWKATRLEQEVSLCRA